MNAILSYEPYKLSAGILALAVHLAFFVLLYFGFTWQYTPPESVSVDLWQSLPESVIVPPEPAEPVQAVESSVVPEAVAKPDIVLPDKKKVEKKLADAKKPDTKESDDKPLPRIIIDTQPIAPAPSMADQQAAQAAREQQEKAAATKRVVDEYVGKITAKIRRNIVEPPDVSKKMRAEFMVTLLPGGMVLNTKLSKTSGDVRYDDAVERAILKSQPLPLPPDVAMFKNFRELKLGFEPEQ